MVKFRAKEKIHVQMGMILGKSISEILLLVMGHWSWAQEACTCSPMTDDGFTSALVSRVLASYASQTDVFNKCV